MNIKLIVIGCVVSFFVSANNKLPSCVPLGQPFTLPVGEVFTLTEITDLKNTIFAQHGYKFNSEKTENEMGSRGCKKSVGKFDFGKIPDVDKANIKYLLKKAAQLAPQFDEGAPFETMWNSFERDPEARKKLLVSRFCYLDSASGKTLGVINFTGIKLKGSKNKLTGMFNMQNPTWRPGEDKSFKENEVKRLNNQTADSSVMQHLKFTSSGVWSINSSKTNSNGKLQISIQIEGKKIENTGVEIAFDDWVTKMLLCRLIE